MFYMHLTTEIVYGVCGTMLREYTGVLKRFYKVCLLVIRTYFLFCL